MTIHCPGAELNYEETSHYVSRLEDLDAVKRNHFPEFENLGTQNVRPIVIVLNYGHMYLGKMVRFLLLVLSASFTYIIFQAKLSLLSILITIRCSSTGTPDDSCASVDRD